MIHGLLVGLAAFAVGVLAGIILGHYLFAKAEAATKAELSLWAGRLRTSIHADVQTARSEMSAIVTDIERKL